MIGLAVGLVTGRRELVAAIVGRRRSRVVVALAHEPGHRDRRRAASSGRWSGCSSRRRVARDGAARDAGVAPSATRCRARTSTDVRRPRVDRRAGEDAAMSTSLVLLAVLMFAVTYPSRALGLLAPGLDRLPQRRLRLPAARRAGRPRGAGGGQRHGHRSTTTGVADVPRRDRVAGGVRLPRHRRLAAQPAPRAGRPRSRSSPSRRATGIAGAAGLTLSPRAGVDLDLDEQARVDQGADLDHRRGRPDRRRTPRRGPPATSAASRDVRHEHPGPHDVAEREAGLGRAPRSMIARAARAWAGDITGVARPAVRPGVGRARRPSTRRRRRSPGCSPRRPPTDRPTRSGRLVMRGHGRAGVASPPGEDLGSRAIASSRPASRVVRGTIESTSRYSAGEWSLPPIGPRPSRLGTPMPGRRVGVGRTAGRRVADRRSRARRRRPGHARRAGRSARASPSATSGPSARSRPSCPGPRSPRRSAGSRPRPPRAPRGSTARTSTSSEHRSATTLGRVPPAMTPTLTVTPGQRPLSACRSRTIRAASRIALRPFSGSTPAWAARPWTVDPQVEDALARRHDVAVGAGALEHQRDVARRRRCSRMCGVEVGEPISSSGLATKTSRSNGSAAALADERLERVQPGEQARTSCR